MHCASADVKRTFQTEAFRTGLQISFNQ